MKNTSNEELGKMLLLANYYQDKISTISKIIINDELTLRDIDYLEECLEDNCNELKECLKEIVSIRQYQDFLKAEKECEVYLQ